MRKILEWALIAFVAGVSVFVLMGIIEHTSKVEASGVDTKIEGESIKSLDSVFLFTYKGKPIYLIIVDEANGLGHGTFIAMVNNPKAVKIMSNLMNSKALRILVPIDDLIKNLPIPVYIN